MMVDIKQNNQCFKTFSFVNNKSSQQEFTSLNFIDLNYDSFNFEIKLLKHTIRKSFFFFFNVLVNKHSI